MASKFANSVDSAGEQEKALADQLESIEITGKNNCSGDAQPKPPDTTTTAAANNKKGGSETSSNNEKELPAEEKSSLQKLLQTKLVPSSKDLEIIQKDPTCPLLSVTSFEDLHLRLELLKGVYAMGFETPSRIHEYALPILLSEPPQNLIAQSQSGTGKTTAFVLAMLSRVDPSVHHPQVLCLTPRYELAIQTGNIMEEMGKYCPEIKVRFAIREQTVPQGTKLTEHIIIGTPGKVTDWAFRTRCFDLGKVKVFALHDADVMIVTQGCHDQCIKIHRSLPKDCQKMLFSETYDRDVMKFAERMLSDATIIKLKHKEESLDKIKQCYIESSSPKEKYQAIATICGIIDVGSVGPTIIFCQMRKTVTWLASRLSGDGYSVAIFHGGLGVTQRMDALNRFRDGREKILITTNLLAGGIDVGQVTYVVNYDLPTDVNCQADCETYLHRIGITRRHGRKGIVFNLVHDSKSMQILNTIRAHFGKPIEKLDIDGDDVTESKQLEN